MRPRTMSHQAGATFIWAATAIIGMSAFATTSPGAWKSESLKPAPAPGSLIVPIEAEAAQQQERVVRRSPLRCVEAAAPGAGLVLEIERPSPPALLSDKGAGLRPLAFRFVKQVPLGLPGNRRITFEDPVGYFLRRDRCGYHAPTIRRLS